MRRSATEVQNRRPDFDLFITFDGDIEIERVWYRLKAESLSFPSEQKSAPEDTNISRYDQIEMIA